MRRDDSGAAGVVAGIIMVGALVAFLAYMNAEWVPTWVANKEASHSTELNGAMLDWAESAEDHVTRQLTLRSFTRTVPLGVGGLAVLGTGASSGELSVEAAPRIVVTVGSTTVLEAAGALSASTHTQQYPNQTIRYALGGLEINQSEGAWVDARSMIRAERTTNNLLNLTLQVVDLTGAPQSKAGNAAVIVMGTLTSASNATQSAGDVRIQLTDVSAGAWRGALQRALNATALTSSWATDCTAASTHYCFDLDTNNATSVDLYVLDVTAGWTASLGRLAVELRT